MCVAQSTRVNGVDNVLTLGLVFIVILCDNKDVLVFYAENQRCAI